MRKILMLLILTAFSAGLYGAENASVNVTVTHIKDIKGTMMMQIFDSAKEYNAKKGKAAAQTMVKVTGTTMTIIFKDLSPGIYAIKSFQDKNENGKLDTALMIPSEPFGISNNPQLMGPPKFKDASFELKPGSNEITIKLSGI